MQDFALSCHVSYLLISDNGPFTLQFQIEKTCWVDSLVVWVISFLEILNIASKSEYGIGIQPLISGFDAFQIETGVGATIVYVLRLML